MNIKQLIVGVVIHQCVWGVASRGHDESGPVIPVVEIFLRGHGHFLIYDGGLHSTLKSVG